LNHLPEQVLSKTGIVGILDEANKKRYYHGWHSVLWSASQPPGGGNIIFEKPGNSACRSAAIQSVLAINQRVKSAIGTAEKIERNSRSKKREKGLSTGRSPFGRIAVSLLFATKPG
jgi:hypothetical protein